MIFWVSRLRGWFWQVFKFPFGLCLKGINLVRIDDSDTILIHGTLWAKLSCDTTRGLVSDKPTRFVNDLWAYGHMPLPGLPAEVLLAVLAMHLYRVVDRALNELRVRRWCIEIHGWYESSGDTFLLIILSNFHYLSGFRLDKGHLGLQIWTRSGRSFKLW